MGSRSSWMLGLLVLVCLGCFVASHPLCSDTTTAVIPNPLLQFCTQYNQNGSCCSLNDNTKYYKDAYIQSNYTSVGVDPNSVCGQFLQQIMCTKCDPWAAHLTGVIGTNERPGNVPFLCPDYCNQLYTACRDVSMNAATSPFGTSKISNLWPTVGGFCNSTWAVYGGYCFSGQPYVDPTPTNFNANKGFCMDRVVAKSTTPRDYITMTSTGTKVYIASREGLINVFQITPRGPFISLGTFLDLTSRVYLNGEGGLLGMAFYPNNPSRFFVSYICSPLAFDDCRWDRICTQNSDCLFPGICLGTGRCGCLNSTQCGDGGVCVSGNCMTGTTSGISNHVQMTIVAEYTVDPNNPNAVLPTETKRILEVSRPGANHNGGQILFSPIDNYLYIFQGDGGGNGARSSQDSRSFLGKVLRIDVSSTAASPRYVIPPTNPYYGAQPIGANGYRPEIWAEGMRNPWRNSFDSTTGTLWNGDVGDETIEEVNQILPGKNYGWRKFEGYIQWNSDALDPKPTLGNNTLPKMYYTHASMYPNNGACVIGGYWYRGSKSNCYKGQYIFSDELVAFFRGFQDTVPGLYAIDRVSWACGSDPSSSLSCLGPTFPAPKLIYSLGDDSQGNIYWLTDQGVFQLIEDERCPQFICPVGTQTYSGIATTQATSLASTQATSLASTQATSQATSQASSQATNAQTTAVVSTTGGITTGAVTPLGDFDFVCSNIPNLTRNGSIVLIPTCYSCVNSPTGFNRINQPGTEANVLYVISGLTGTYDPTRNGGAGQVHVYADAGNVGQQTLQSRLRYDFDGDGLWDRIEILDKYPLGDLVNWEDLSIADVTKRFFTPSTTGTFRNMTQGVVELMLWQSSGNSQIEIISGGVLSGLVSWVEIPYQLSTPSTCSYLILGNPPIVTTGQVTTGVATTGTTGAVITSIQTSIQQTSNAQSSQPLATSVVSSNTPSTNTPSTNTPFTNTPSTDSKSIDSTSVQQTGLATSASKATNISPDSSAPQVQNNAAQRRGEWILPLLFIVLMRIL